MLLRTIQQFFVNKSQTKISEKMPWRWGFLKGENAIHPLKCKQKLCFCAASIKGSNSRLLCRELLGIILFFALNVFSFAAWADQDNPLHINFAMEATYPPFEYMDNDGQIIGIDIDLAKAICQQIKAECTFNNQPFASLIPSLKIGKFDAIISAVAITDDREKQVDFTAPYYVQTASFVAPKNSNIVTSPAGLKGKDIGVQAGTTMENYLRKHEGDNIVLKTYGSIIEAFLDLKSGRVDLVFADTPVAMEWLKQASSQDYHVVGDLINEPAFFGKGFGIAVKKGNQSLLNLLNQGLAEIKQNGTYDQLMKKYQLVPE